MLFSNILWVVLFDDIIKGSNCEGVLCIGRLFGGDGVCDCFGYEVL